MEIGIATLACSSWRTAPDIDMMQALGMLAEVGYDCVEYNDQSLPQYFRADEDELRTVAERAAEVGIRMHSAHSPCGDYDLTALDDGKYAEALDVHLHCVEALAEVGVEYFVVHQVGGPSEQYPERYDRAVEALSALCAEAETRGMKILAENFPAHPCAEVRRIVESVGSPDVGICFDVGHAHVDGLSMTGEIEAAGDRLWSLHVHDNDGTGDQHLPPGWGTVDWAEVMRGLHDIGYCGPFMMEVMRERPEAAALSPLEFVRESYAAASDLVSQYAPET